MKADWEVIKRGDVMPQHAGLHVTLNPKGEVVGILFDGNIEGLPNRFVYTDEQARSVHVASQGIAEALKFVYLADNLLKELGLN